MQINLNEGYCLLLTKRQCPYNDSFIPTLECLYNNYSCRCDSVNNTKHIVIKLSMPAYISLKTLLDWPEQKIHVLRHANRCKFAADARLKC